VAYSWPPRGACPWRHGLLRSATPWAGRLWIAACSPSSPPTALLWSPRPGWGRAGVRAASSSWPYRPLGIVGWPPVDRPPGVLCPGWGWLGLGAAATAMLVLTTRFVVGRGPGRAGRVALVRYERASPPAPDGWRGVDTTMGAMLGAQRISRSIENCWRMCSARPSRAPASSVLPESALGVWTPTVSQRSG